jgi:cell division protein ZapA (FtsZ GTPase activity inhibitor)
MIQLEENANRVDVVINDKHYKMKSNDDIEYMKEIAETVNGMMAEVHKNNKKLGREDLAILTALNLADRLRRAEYELESTKDDFSKAQAENKGLKRNTEELTKELNDFIIAFDKTKNLKL